MENKVKSAVFQSIDQNASAFEQMSDKIWEYAEIKFEEVRSAQLQIDFLKENGFRITPEIGGVKTAFVAEYGSGKPVIGFCGEFDALPGLEQAAGCPEEKHSQPPKSGHGCGHNLLGVACLEAAFAVKAAIEAGKLCGTVRYYGCPAEEGGGGKGLMIRAGAFRDVDIALAWHPSAVARLFDTSKAIAKYVFSFKGISSHAATMPENGRSALDAAELMNVGTNFLREHLKSGISIQYAFLDAGGINSNVVQSHASLSYAVRGANAKDIRDTYERIVKIAKGAAMMTETELEKVEQELFIANSMPNETLNRLICDNAEPFFPIEYTEEELALAREFVKVGTMPGAVEAFNTRFDTRREMPFPGSTDFGDVSWVVPAGSFGIPTCVVGTRGHSWQRTAQGTVSYAHKGMHVAGKIMAACAVDLMQDEQLVENAKQDFAQTLGDLDYFKLFA